MARTVYGVISNQGDGGPMPGALVEAWDSDFGPDDFMGSAITDAGGSYSIQYAGGHWDPAPHGLTYWRPDIYIRVHLKNNAGNWIRVHESSVYSDHKLREDLRIDARVEAPNPYARTAWGYLRWRDTNQPAAGVFVSVWDADWGFTGGEAGPTDNGYQATAEFGPSAESMGSGTTDKDGFYAIPYAGKHWDRSLFQSLTYWRPDIFIVVTGTDSQGNSHTLYKSAVHSNVPHREGVRIDAAIEPIAEVVEAFKAEAQTEKALKEGLANGKLTIEAARQSIYQQAVARTIRRRAVAKVPEHGSGSTVPPRSVRPAARVRSR